MLLCLSKVRFAIAPFYFFSVLMTGATSLAGEPSYPLAPATISGFDYDGLYQELYVKNKKRSTKGDYKYVTSHPLFTFTAVNFVQGECRSVEVLSWFDFKGERAFRKFEEAVQRRLPKALCELGSEMHPGVNNKFHIWLLNDMFTHSQKMGRKRANWLDEITEPLLRRAAPLDEESRDNLLDRCKFNCSPDPVYLASVMFAVADSFDADSRPVEAYIWRDTALTFAKEMAFFKRRASDVLFEQALMVTEYQINNEDFIEADDSLAIAESITTNLRTTKIRDTLRRLEARKSFEPLNSDNIRLVGPHPFNVDQAGNFSRKVHGNRFRFKLHSGSVEYAVLFCESGRFPVDVAVDATWHLNDELGGENCSLLALGEPDTVVSIASSD